MTLDELTSCSAASSRSIVNGATSLFNDKSRLVWMESHVFENIARILHKSHTFNRSPASGCSIPKWGELRMRNIVLRRSFMAILVNTGWLLSHDFLSPFCPTVHFSPRVFLSLWLNWFIHYVNPYSYWTSDSPLDLYNAQHNPFFHSIEFSSLCDQRYDDNVLPPLAVRVT